MKTIETISKETKELIKQTNKLEAESKILLYILEHYHKNQGRLARWNSYTLLIKTGLHTN